MRRIGFIGYGSMGSMLVDGFINSGKLDQRDVVVFTQTPQKLTDLKERFPNIKIAVNNSDVVAQSAVVFICVKPLSVESVLTEVREKLTPDKHLVSIAAGVTLANLASRFAGKISKVIPSLTSQVGKGISLICHNSLVGREDADFVEDLFGAVSTVKLIKEENFEAGADLTSCAPGLIAAMFREFVEAGVRNSSLSRQECEEMVVATLYGTAEILCKQSMGFEQMIARVATKGGITEEGVKVLREQLPTVFDGVFANTLAKHEHIKGLINKQFRP